MPTLSKLMNLSGRKAIVTGAAGHIGREVCDAIIELGGTIGLLDRDESACKEYAEQLSQSRKGAAFEVTCDLSQEDQTRKSIQEAIGRLGGLDILVHCAAYMGSARMDGWAVPFEKQSVAAWDVAMRVNLTAPFIMVQEAQKELIKSRHGSVILFSSIYGSVGPDHRLYENTEIVNPTGYGASKGGIVQLTRYLATSLAPHVRVNCISPGGVLRGQPKVFVDRYVERTPLGRMAKEEDIRGAAAYLASDLSTYVTGHNLVVDGGWTAW